MAQKRVSKKTKTKKAKKTQSRTAAPTTSRRDPKPSRDPKASRPGFPPEYGVAQGRKGLLEWQHARERLETAITYWIATVTPAGLPHVNPVDGIWLDDRLYFGGSPNARWFKNLAANPHAALHLENGIEAVILHGRVEAHRAGRELAIRLSQATSTKYAHYGMEVTPEYYEESEMLLVFIPETALAWTHLPKDATRFRF